MYVTMNRFRVKRGCEREFEALWLGRETYLHETPGFREFNLLRGPEQDEYTLYASQTVWASEAAFSDWTRSEAFRKAHAGAGGAKPLYIDAPLLEVFSVIERQTAKTATAA